MRKKIEQWVIKEIDNQIYRQIERQIDRRVIMTYIVGIDKFTQSIKYRIES